MRELQRSAAHAAGPAERRLGLWLEASGHFRSRAHVVAERTRDDWLVMHVVAGRGMVRNGAHRLAVQAGMAVACFPHVPHEYRSDPEAGWEIHWAHFGGAQAARLAELCGLAPERAAILPGTGSELVGQWLGLLDALEGRAPHAGLDASARLYRLLVDLACRGRGGGAEQHRLLDAATGDPEDLDGMARAAGMSRFAYARAFKRGMGITPWRYVLLQRIARAKQLLADGERPVKEVAAACGFTDADYFCRAFRREAGMTPGEYRRQRS